MVKHLQFSWLSDGRFKLESDLKDYKFWFYFYMSINMQLQQDACLQIMW
jgi:hypothetical protein